MVYKLRRFLSRKHLPIFYEAYAESIINFGVIIYGCTYRSYLQDISNFQKLIVRSILSFIKKFNSVSEIFLIEKIFSVFDLYAYISAVFFELFERIREVSHDIVAHIIAQNSCKLGTRKASRTIEHITKADTNSSTIYCK